MYRTNCFHENNTEAPSPQANGATNVMDFAAAYFVSRCNASTGSWAHPAAAI
jgi:hypothetical protein